MMQEFWNPMPPPKEGDVYKVIAACGRTFTIYYGYYEEKERLDPTIEPMPIYPDFIKEPIYSEEGRPLVTLMQDACEHYEHKSGSERDCSSCRYFERCRDMFGICLSEKRKR